LEGALFNAAIVTNFRDSRNSSLLRPTHNSPAEENKHYASGADW